MAVYVVRLEKTRRHSSIAIGTFFVWLLNKDVVFRFLVRAAPIAWLKSPPWSGISQVFLPRFDHAVLQMALLLISCSRQIISWPAKIYVTRETFSRFISVTLRVIRFENKVKKKLWSIIFLITINAFTELIHQSKYINMVFWNKNDNCD